MTDKPETVADVLAEYKTNSRHLSDGDLHLVIARIDRALAAQTPVAWRIVWSPYPGGTEVTEDQARVLKIQGLESPPAIEPLYATPQPAEASGRAPDGEHTDDIAVNRFASEMKTKLATARAKGRGGWDGPECNAEILSRMLREHVSKGDPRDVANFCMFLWNRGESIVTPPASAPEVTEDATDTEIEAWAIRHGFDGWSATDRRAAFEDAQTWSRRSAALQEGKSHD